MSIFKQYIQAKLERNRDRFDSILALVSETMVCQNISTMSPIFMDGALGYYNSTAQAKIIVSEAKQNNGFILADTLYHEDRHYQQHINGTLPSDEDYIECHVDYLGYRNQRCEYDARRYAYIKVCRNCTGVHLYKKLGLYKLLFHPWKGLAYKVAPLEAGIRKLFSK